MRIESNVIQLTEYYQHFVPHFLCFWFVFYSYNKISLLVISESYMNLTHIKKRFIFLLTHVSFQIFLYFSGIKK